MEYSLDDLSPIDPIEHIRRNPDMYLGTSIDTPAVLIANAMALEAKTLGASRVEIVDADGWKIVRADLDWLNVECSHHVTVEQVFWNICAFPEAGVNSMRAEVLATAFSDAVVTYSQESRYLVKGCQCIPSTVWSWLEANAWIRVVAFQL